ncbi:exodeoxyribonuclease V subunit beta [Methylotenera sp.]|uniref:UvrD-helicase domain-containing protein n=1 Tax=Methylotenera sp. TaxID=2051956 RepID=UPI002735C712|nr:UvrD-helicase domain-containing protein [Methylotenera sp.]MDP3210491.1 UvrD-helicase domain-containing protein [Methylotenera sp.]
MSDKVNHMASDALADDAQNRLRALDLTSFIVEAPAGAGKTELLTQRYLKLLQTVKAPEEIIAITFTNKAAAEMRLRILDSLLKAASQDKPAEPHKQITYQLSLKALQQSEQHNWQLIENPSRLRIFTIDSLCAHLARQMPLMSRFGAQPGVTVDAGVLYAQAAEQALALVDSAEHSELVKTALRYVDNDANQLKNLLVKMLEKRDQWLHHAQHEVDAEALQQTLRYLVEQEIEAAALALPFRLQHLLMPIARFAASNLPCDHAIALLIDWETPIVQKQEALPMWCAVAELLLTAKGEARKEGGLNVKVGFPATDEGRAQKSALVEIINAIEDVDALHRVRSLPNLSHENTNWQIITTLSKLLTLAVAELWLVFQRAGEVDFVEIAQRATHALTDHFGEPTELALKLDYQIQHLLVDEFQDTSPSQVALIEQLTLGWQADDGRTLFAVGDPMQSIYRFRKANVGLFIDASVNGIGSIYLERLQLYRNNRSCPEIVNWINQTFAPIFPQRDEVMQGAIHYRPFIATKQALPDAGVKVHPIIKQADENYDTAAQREAEAVIRVIQKERTANPNQKIAVLVRSKKHLANLVSQLRRDYKEIPFQAVEIEALEGRQIVQDLLSLMHALHHRADRVHWLAILRAPWCGLTLHDLYALAGNDHHQTIWSLMQDSEVVGRLSADGKTRLLHMREVLLEAYANQGRMNVSRWIRGVWLMLNGPDCLWEQADVVDVQAFFSCLDNLDRSNQFSPERMQSEINKLFAAPDSHGEHLQMMTIHKSKGLEFDTVILLGLGASTGGNNSDQPLVLWEEVKTPHSHELLAAPYIPKGARDKESVSPYDYLASREKARDANESARVLYVAATRVERKLHLVGIANQNAKGEINPTKNTYLDLLWPTVAPIFEADLQVEGTTQPLDDIASFTPQLVRLTQPAIPQILLTHRVAITQPKPNVKPSYQNSLEADMGILAHRYMEMMAQQGLAHWTTDRVASLAPSMQHWLRQQGHVESVAKEATATLQLILKQTLNSADGQWVLQTRPDAAAELGITCYDQGGVKGYVIDRTFIEDGVRWIIDYKSLSLESNLTDNEFKTVAEQYRPQLDDYAMLFSDQAVPVKKAIFFLSAGKLIII